MPTFESVLFIFVLLFRRLSSLSWSSGLSALVGQSTSRSQLEFLSLSLPGDITWRPLLPTQPLSVVLEVVVLLLAVKGRVNSTTGLYSKFESCALLKRARSHRAGHNEQRFILTVS